MEMQKIYEELLQKRIKKMEELNCKNCIWKGYDKSHPACRNIKVKAYVKPCLEFQEIWKQV